MKTFQDVRGRGVYGKVYVWEEGRWISEGEPGVDGRQIPEETTGCSSIPYDVSPCNTKYRRGIEVS